VRTHSILKAAHCARSSQRQCVRVQARPVRWVMWLAAAIITCLLVPTAASAQDLKVRPTIRDGEVVDVFVDERGKIYKELRYHGIIPELRDHFLKTRKRKKKKQAVTWVGFQPKRFYSRIFIQVRGLSRFVLHKPDPRTIVVKIDGAAIPSRQTLRSILTGAFSSSVQEVKARRRRGGAEVTITLRKPVGYLYKQEGNYIYVDVER
jgi:hypothetical protein